jgi:hypothetical protein
MTCIFEDCDLDAVYCAGHAKEASESSLPLEMFDALTQLSEFLEGQVDVVDGDYGEPRPNRAMQLKQTIDELIERYERENPQPEIPASVVLVGLQRMAEARS